MRKSVIALVALGLFCAGAEGHAATYENGTRLVAAMVLQTEIDRAIGDAVAAVRAQLDAKGAPAQRVDAFIAAFRDELEAAAPELGASLARAYADRFSDAEFDDLIAFYESPTGQKLVDVQHDLAAAQVQAVAQWIVAAAQAATAKANAANGASV